MGSYDLKPCVICDIDGTVADVEWRRCWVDGSKGKKDFKKFHSLMSEDPAIKPMVGLLNMYHLNGWHIIFCTGRLEKDRGLTLEWLHKKGVLCATYPDKVDLRMRPDKDVSLKDCIVKQTMLDNLLEEGWEPKIVFDDRQQVVDMWRSNGLYVHQVDVGNF